MRALILVLGILTLIPLRSLQAGTFVRFRTVFGDVEVELLDKERPITVQNFLQYVRDGAYSGMFFHRVVPNFIIQGGGFVNTAPGTTNEHVGQIATRPPITNEFGIGPLISNATGTIAMAKTADPNSATSQFFFNLANNATSLDSTNNSGGFTVFGRVVGGTNTLALLNTFDGARVPQTNYIVNAGGALSELPVVHFPPTGAETYFSILVYCDITLLDVQVAKQADSSRKITWSSAVNATNVVEYTTNFPPVWTTLTNLVRPAAGVSQAVDPAGDPNRFYRVRTAY